MGHGLETTGQTVNNDEAKKYLAFRVAGQRYGIPIEAVIEIVQILTITELPELPNYAKGVIHLRGQVIPLIDVNLRFGKPEKEYTDRTCIIIVDVVGTHMGLIVEAVEEVLNVDGSQIATKPSFFEGSSSRYITNMAKTDGYVVLLLNTDLLVAGMDRNT